MIYITTTDWKKKYEGMKGKLTELLVHYANDSDIEVPVKELIQSIDSNQYDVYYTVVKEDLEAILQDTDLSAEGKLSVVQSYLTNLL